LTFYIMSGIFKAYDIRGKYPQEINKKIACQVGQAFVDFVKSKTHCLKPKIIVGRDLRQSSTALFAGLIIGLTKKKAKIISVGKVPSDALYFAHQYLKADGSIMITASHNPLSHNGFKLVVKNYGFICRRHGMEKLKLKVKSQKLKVSKKGLRSRNIEFRNIIPDYVNHILKVAEKLGIKNSFKTFRIGVETLGGMAGKIIQPLGNKISLKVNYLNTLTSRPNPLLTRNLEKIIQQIKKKQLNFGLVLDGDADRCIFLDEKGKKINNDLILALFSTYLLSRKPKAKIVYTVNCSKIVKEEIKKYGGTPILSRVGHSFSKSMAKKEKAVLGGEISGHFYWQENNYSECPSLALLLMLQILSNKKQKLSKVIKPFQKYYKSDEINLSLKEKKAPAEIYKKISSRFKKGKIDYLDGLTIEFSDWWFNLRSSHTEPVLRLVIEAKNKKMFLEKKKKITKFVNECMNY